MKTIALFLSLFFALLVTLPCNDTVSLSSNSSASTLEKNDSTSHSDNDACSVFCSCACCGIVMVSENLIITIEENKAAIHTSKIPDFQNFQLLKIPFGIWQPPKLS